MTMMNFFVVNLCVYSITSAVIAVSKAIKFDTTVAVLGDLSFSFLLIEHKGMVLANHRVMSYFLNHTKFCWCPFTLPNHFKSQCSYSPYCCPPCAFGEGEGENLGGIMNTGNVLLNQSAN